MDIDYDNEPKLSIINAASKSNIQFIRQEGGRWVGICPFCEDKSGHLYLTVNDGKYKNVYKCQKCGASGSAISLYAQLHGINNKEAYKELMEFEVPGSVKHIIKIMNDQSKIKQNEIMPLSQRHDVYSSLLSKLELEINHINNLLGRGLTIEQIRQGKYKTIPQNSITRERICHELLDEGHILKGVPGFYVNKTGEWDFISLKGFLIPILDINGYIQGMQIRIDNAVKKKYRWFSSSKEYEGTRCNGWIHVKWNTSHTANKVVITEGPLKANVASFLSDTTFIALPGVGVYKNLPQILKQLKSKEIFIAYDMDYKKTPEVANHLNNMKTCLHENGFQFKMSNWNPEYKGIDDYLYSIMQKRKAQIAN